MKITDPLHPSDVFAKKTKNPSGDVRPFNAIPLDVSQLFEIESMTRLRRKHRAKVVHGDFYQSG